MIWQVGLYAAAVLIPLAAFAVEAIFIRQLKRYNAYLATGAIGLSCLLSPDRLPGLHDREQLLFPPRRGGGERGGTVGGAAALHGEGSEDAAHHKPLVWSGSVDWVILGGAAAATTAEISARPPPSPTWRFPWALRSTI